MRAKHVWMISCGIAALFFLSSCALLPEVKPLPPLVVDSDKCVGCKMCMRIGCPAISVTDGKAAIDPTLCVGCDLCIQMCRPGAIGKNQEV